LERWDRYPVFIIKEFAYAFASTALAVTLLLAAAPPLRVAARSALKDLTRNGAGAT
jgi:hypothetical protein